MDLGKLYGVGLGPGDPKLITLRAAEILRSVDLIFTVISPNAQSSTSRSIVESLNPKGEIRTLSFSMSRNAEVRSKNSAENAAKIVLALQAGQHCAFATLGDPMTYCTFGYVLPLIRETLPNLDVEIVPGITSFAMLAARSQQVLVENGETLRVIPVFRADQAEALRFPQASSTILLKTYRNREKLWQRLEQEQDITLVYGENLGMAEEYLSESLDTIKERPVEYLSLVLVKKS